LVPALVLLLASLLLLPVARPALSLAVGVFGAGVAGEAFWLGAGVGDPKLS
jgi:hypothetical protein